MNVILWKKYVFKEYQWNFKEITQTFPWYMSLIKIISDFVNIYCWNKRRMVLQMTIIKFQTKNKYEINPKSYIKKQRPYFTTTKYKQILTDWSTGLYWKIYIIRWCNGVRL